MRSRERRTIHGGCGGVGAGVWKGCRLGRTSRGYCVEGYVLEKKSPVWEAEEGDELMVMGAVLSELALWTSCARHCSASLACSLSHPHLLPAQILCRFALALMEKSLAMRRFDWEG